MLYSTPLTRINLKRLQNNEAMIHPLQQSVTWCKCRKTLMAGQRVSFTYIQGYIA